MNKSVHSVTRMFSAFRHRNYRLYFLGQGISLVGTWLSRLAAPWLVYRLTGSEAMLGVVGFVSQFPAFMLSPLGGVLVDRLDRRRVLVASQAVLMGVSLLLAYLTASGDITVAWLIGLSAVQGVATAFDMPARHSLIVQVVPDKAHLSSAIALNSALVNGARLVGPALAGIIIASVGEAVCFLIDGLSYVAVITALVMLRLTPVGVGAAPRRKNIPAELREGFAYAFGHAEIRPVLILLAATSLFGVPYLVLMPAMADKMLGGGSLTLGLLTGASGLGAIAGSAYLALHHSLSRLARLVGNAAVLFGLTLVPLGLANHLWLALPLMALSGAIMMVHWAAGNTLLQTLVEDSKRGRVMSLFTMAFMGMMPLGSLAAGAVAEQIGPDWTIIASGLLCATVSLLLRWRLRAVTPSPPETAKVDATAAAASNPETTVGPGGVRVET